MSKMIFVLFQTQKKNSNAIYTLVLGRLGVRIPAVTDLSRSYRLTAKRLAIDVNVTGPQR